MGAACVGEVEVDLVKSSFGEPEVCEIGREHAAIAIDVTAETHVGKKVAANSAYTKP